MGTPPSDTTHSDARGLSAARLTIAQPNWERVLRCAISTHCAGGCDVFAPDLVYSIPEVAHGTREMLCANLAKMLARSDVRLHYDNPDVQRQRLMSTAM